MPEATAKARIEAAFEQYRTRPRPTDTDLMGAAWQPGDEANGAFCALVGWLTGLAGSESPVTRVRLAEAVEHAVASALGNTDPKEAHR